MGIPDDNIGEWVNTLFTLNPDTAIHDSTAKPAKVHKLDLFAEVLPALDRGDIFYYKSLTDDEKDSIEPWMLMRWLTSAASDRDQSHYLLMVNDLVNEEFSRFAAKKTMSIEGHKELQWMLLSLCMSGSTVRRKFMKPGKGVVKNRIEELLTKHNPSLNDEEIGLLQQINTPADLEQFFKDNALDDKSINELLKIDAKGKK